MTTTGGLDPGLVRLAQQPKLGPILPKLPGSVQQPLVPEALPRPVAKIRHGLRRRSFVKTAGQIVAADDPEYFDIDHLRR